jgi:hypothetical protein
MNGKNWMVLDIRNLNIGDDVYVSPDKTTFKKAYNKLLRHKRDMMGKFDSRWWEKIYGLVEVDGITVIKMFTEEEARRIIKVDQL